MKKKFAIFGSSSFVIASSVALFLHFNSLQNDLNEVRESYKKLDEKYNHVLSEKQELQKIIETNDKELKEAQMEIQQLLEKNKDLNSKNKQLQSENQQLNQKLEKLLHDGWQTFRLTYYDNDYESTGKNPGDPYYGITASGRPTQEGISVAVDPRIIPLDSWLLIKWPDGTIEKRRADDTGGLIKGHRIDYYVPEVTSEMGVDYVQVKVIS